MPDMIRALGEKDFDAYIALRQQALRECPLSFSASAEDDFASSHDSLRKHLATDSVLFGAFDGDALAGAVGLFRQRRAKSAHRALIWGMYVAPGQREHGLGARLLQAAIAHARTLPGIAWIDLDVTAAAPAARRLYERAGFQVWGTRQDALRNEGHAVDEHHMALQIITA
jgi:RimJ/RimL family protein N-acetyltransferase